MGGKKGRDGVPSQEGSLKKREVSKHQETLCQVCGELWNHRGQHNREEKFKKKKLKPTDYEPSGNSPSGVAAQKPASTTSKRGLGREVQVALLRVRTRPECPEGNLRELTSDSKPDCGITTT